MMAARIRVGFVGLGGIARQRHMPGLRKLDDVQVVAVVNRSRESSERAAAEFGIPIVCDTWQELVRRDDVDAVFIGTWPYLHCPVSVAALESGKHVFCQARMAMNYGEALRMRDAARAAGRVAMVCPVPYGLSVDAAVRRMLREGTLGEVRLVRVESLSDVYASPDAPMNWRKDERLSGLNMLTLGMFIEVIHRWFGVTRAVCAQMDIFVPERTDVGGCRRQVQIPDQILFNAEMPGNVPVQYVFSAAVRQAYDRIEIHGSEGSVCYEPGAEQLLAAKPREPFLPVAIPAEEAYDVQNWRVEQDFINAIRYGADYHPTFEEGLQYMRVIQAVYDSAAKGRKVQLAEYPA